MKVAIINNLYPPFNRGGAEKIVLQQADNLIQQGHQVFVVTTCPLFKNPSINNQSYKIYYFYPWNIFSVYYLSQFPFLLRAVWRMVDILNFYTYFKLKKILAKEKPDVVYAHNLTGLSYLLPRLFKKMKIKYIQIIHDVALIRPSGLLIYGREQGSLLIKLYVKLTKYLFNSPDEVIFPSRWIKDYYSQHGFFPATHKRVVKNFNLKVEDLLINKSLKDLKQINFLYLGQIEKHKGVLFLIQVFQALPEYIQAKCSLSIIGEGKELASAKELAAQNKQIIFYGYQPPNKIKKFFKQVDYLIVPSLCYENSPTVIFEALNNQIPVIAPALGGIPELVVNNQNGYLFKPHNQQELLKIIKKTFNAHFKNL